MAVRYRHSAIFRGLLVLAASVLDAGGAAQAAGEVAQMGTWQTHQITFHYMGDVTTGTFYSCEGLQDALSFLLQQSGARLNKSVEVDPCGRGAGAPSTLLTARLDFSTFTPDTGAAEGQGPSVPGSWRPVLFSEPHSSPQLRFADCELVSEFRDKLLTLFATRDVKANLHCIPFQDTSGLYGLSFEAFVPSNTAHRAVGGG